MYKNFSIYLIGLLPLALIIGPFIGELVLFLIFILFSLTCLKEKKYFLFKDKVFKYFIIFCFYISFLSLFASEILISAKSSFFYFRFGLYVISIVYLLSEVKNSLDIIYEFYKYTILFLVIDSVFQVFFGFDVLGIKPINTDLMRISGPFGDKYVLGSFLQKILPVFIYLITKKYQIIKKIKLLDLVILILSFSLIYRSGDRSALALILLFSFIFFIINKDLRKKASIVLVSFVILSSLFSLQNPKIFERNFKNTIGQFKGKYYEPFLNKNLSETNLNFMIFSFHHQSHYSTAFRMFLDKPLFGHGVKMFRYECNKFEYKPAEKIIIFNEAKKSYGCSTHPHNTYLQMLAEVGLTGFIILFSLFLFFFLKIFYYFKNNQQFYPESTLVIAIFVNLWPLIPTGNFFNNWLSMIYFIPISYYLYELKIKKNN